MSCITSFCLKEVNANRDLKEQVETLLKNQETSDQHKDGSHINTAFTSSTIPQAIPDGFLGNSDQIPVTFPESISPPADPFPNLQSNPSANASSGNEEFPWEMIGLGLDEPLPPQDVINEL